MVIPSSVKSGRGNSPAALCRLSVAVDVLRSFLDVACQSPLSELAEDLAYYVGIVASPLQMARSARESVSSIGSKVVWILALCAELTRLSKGPAFNVVEPLHLAKKGALEFDYATICDWVVLVTP
ncbi:hypothetical protein MRB53_025483 [Persea americana]|uniref:Uncharacterized protein n=1 Tax=Persea americana TaxID=3435 RepID=A0ACC2LGC5_PERAE|nr:hypothetical protein MRB53_025483 [Persea americana]